MEFFMNHDLNIDKIIMSYYFASKNKEPSQKNRKNHALLYILNAERTYSFSDGNEITVKNGDLLFIPKGLPYTVSGKEIREGYSICFETQETNLEPFLLRPKNSSYFLDSFKSAASVWSNKSVGYQMRCKAELYNIICNMQSEYELNYISKSTISRLNPAIEYIHKEYTKNNISIPYLATLCNMSEVLFRRHFKNSMGLSPLRYINNLKIARAKELLNFGMCSVTEAAFLSGFHDECYFSREFKRATGVAPSIYKKSG
ncbi:MAG: helix-turn-helix transcriptional regulator [Clostridia bacterium]|nr:helix-turn-helix transcriptional regulator [Clostridia bacterium]